MRKINFEVEMSSIGQARGLSHEMFSAELYGRRLREEPASTETPLIDSSMHPSKKPKTGHVSSDQNMTNATLAMPQPKRELTGDRFIPLRSAMGKARSAETYTVQPPQTAYQQQIMQALNPYYTPKTLLYRQPQEYKPDFRDKFPGLWKFPAKADKILDAPDISRDFYHNNIDWGPVFAINLSNQCYTWNRNTNQTEEAQTHPYSLTALKWNPEAPVIACGDEGSVVSLMDVNAKKLIRPMKGYDGSSILSMDWRNRHELTFGTVTHITHQDSRQQNPSWSFSPTLDKICSLTWHPHHNLFATGSNDNSVRVFDIRRFSERLPSHVHTHAAAVKALRWIPGREAPLLLSGGGTEDKCFKIVSVDAHKVLCEAQAEAQICDAVFLDPEHFVAGLGFSAQNKLQLWRFVPNYSILNQVDGKSSLPARVLNVSKDPKSPTVAAISEEEELHIWDMQSLVDVPHKPKQKSSKGLLFGSTIR
jgi:hypothetical protein